VSSFHDPASWFVSFVFAAGRFLFLALFDVRLIAAVENLLESGNAPVSSIKTKTFLLKARGWRSRDGRMIEGIGQESGVRDIGSADDKEERDATRVDLQVALAAFFFPDRLDWPQHIPKPEVLYA
jgi:hypothetical protein